MGFIVRQKQKKCLVSGWLQLYPRPDITEGAYDAPQNPLVGWGGTSPFPRPHTLNHCPLSAQSGPAPMVFSAVST